MKKTSRRDSYCTHGFVGLTTEPWLLMLSSVADERVVGVISLSNAY